MFALITQTVTSVLIERLLWSLSYHESRIWLNTKQPSSSFRYPSSLWCPFTGLCPIITSADSEDVSIPMLSEVCSCSSNLGFDITIATLSMPSDGKDLWLMEGVVGDIYYVKDTLTQQYVWRHEYQRRGQKCEVFLSRLEQVELDFP